jgi:hypothetical protein
VCPAAGVGLSECLDAGVLIGEGDVVGFRHELARRATLDRIDGYRLQVLHGRTLGALSESLSDADIATKLSISPKTVGHHVEAILAKLGVDNRTQAAASARQSRTIDD